jgi:transposase
VEKWLLYSDIQLLRRKGFSISKIAKKMGVSRNTVYKYLEMNPMEVSEWMAATKVRSKKLDPFRDIILVWLKEHPDLSSAQVEDWLKERYGKELGKIGEATIRRFVRGIREQYHIPKVTVKRSYQAIPDPPMGKQIQVDFGEIKVRDTNNQEKRLWFISFVLSHSRFKYVEWLDRPFITRDVLRCHEHAFRMFGGITEEIVYDQDRLISKDENAGDLILTVEFQSYVKDRGFRVPLCRKNDPESKGRIENVVGYVKKNFAKNRVFTNLEKWNEQCLKWLERTGNHNVHNTTKKRPVEVYTLEKQHLRPISSTINYSNVDNNSITRSIRKDNTVRYKSNRYSVPLGTYKHGRENTVYLEVTNDQLIISQSPNGLVLASHKVDDRKGQLIQDRQHTRDRTKGIHTYMETISKRFNKAEKALGFLEKVRENYPRYIRDQLQVISKAINKNEYMANEALEYCISEKLYSVNDLYDIVNFLIRENDPSHN